MCKWFKTGGKNDQNSVGIQRVTNLLRFLLWQRVSCRLANLQTGFQFHTPFDEKISYICILVGNFQMLLYTQTHTHRALTFQTNILFIPFVYGTEIMDHLCCWLLQDVNSLSKPLMFVGPSQSLTPTSAVHLLGVTQWWVPLKKWM